MRRKYKCKKQKHKKRQLPSKVHNDRPPLTRRFHQITRSGRIVPDKEYRHKLIQRHHQRHIRECLAQAIFHKVLEMEVRKQSVHRQLIWASACIINKSRLLCGPPIQRVHQIEIKRRLEEFARRERVHKIKVLHLHVNTACLPHRPTHDSHPFYKSSSVSDFSFPTSTLTLFIVPLVN